MALQILSIHAVPDFDTYNRSYNCPCPKNKSSLIWANDIQKEVVEGLTGSSRCVTFHLAVDHTTNAWLPVKLNVTAVYPLLGTWYKSPNQGPPATFKVAARLPGRADLLISDNIQVTSPADTSMGIKAMHVVESVFEIPFRNAGDWLWSVQRTDVPGPPIFSPLGTRLELSFVFAPSVPSGPWETDSADHLTAPDFEDKYYVDLFRLFFPSQMEVIDGAGSNKSQRDRMSWYLKRSMRTIWNFGLVPHPEYPDRPITRYDTAAAQSFYLSPIPGLARSSFLPRYGGFFELRRWVQGAYGYCNAFDLAALVQLACSLVQDAKGIEVFGSRWVCSTGNHSLGQWGWGYINHGTLFGWPQYPQCNSVLFSSGGLTSYPKDRNAERVPISWHAWIEVLLPGTDTRYVLDASQAFGEHIDKLALVDGTLSRGEYLTLKMDPAWPDPSRLPNRDPDRKNVDAIIFCQSCPFPP